MVRGSSSCSKLVAHGKTGNDPHTERPLIGVNAATNAGPCSSLHLLHPRRGRALATRRGRRARANVLERADTRWATNVVSFHISRWYLLKDETMSYICCRVFRDLRSRFSDTSVERNAKSL
eukprot:6201750-Pleurochrysis_carterae.AAC.2